MNYFIFNKIIKNNFYFLSKMSKKKNIENETSIHNKTLDNLSNIKIDNYKGIDDLVYNIKIIKEKDSILFQSIIINDFTEIIYSKEYTMKEIKKIDGLKEFKSSEEIFKKFFKKYKKKEIIIYKKDYKINLCFKFKLFNNNDELKEANFILEPETLNQNKLIFKLCDKIEELNIKINELNKIVIEQITINNNNSKKLDKNKLNSNEEKNKVELNKGNKTFFSTIIKCFLSSKLLLFIFGIIILFFCILRNDFKKQIKKEDKEANKIYNFISDYHLLNLVGEDYFYQTKLLINEGIKKNYNKNIKKYKLLYKASRDGFGVEDFHKKCDGKNFTVTLVHTKNNKLFGGFTDAEWDKSAEYKKGNKGFIFSINNHKIYYNKNSDYNIYCSYISGPVFGNFNFKISNNSNQNNDSYDKTYSKYSAYDTPDNEYSLAGENNFIVLDYAVYQIELE